jgi:hypothetical protein
MWGRVDYFLYQNWIPLDRHLLGKSNMASSYRAELLGLCTLHLLAHAVVEYYKVVGWSSVLCCNNKCALELCLTTYVTKGPALNAQTYVTSSRQPSCFSTVPSNMYMYTNI